MGSHADSRVRVEAISGYANGNVTIYDGAKFELDRSTADVYVKRGLVKILGPAVVEEKEAKAAAKKKRAKK